MFNPLPSIALLPLALIWFGLGSDAVIFVLIHAVLWAVALNTFAGFRSVSPTLKMVGQNYGLSRPGYVLRLLIPGAFPSILTGLKIGWAFAWRTLIAAELVFGAQGGTGTGAPVFASSCLVGDLRSHERPLRLGLLRMPVLPLIVLPFVLLRIDLTWA
jgi:NitT/TauT family transport system permease protein